MSQKLSAAIAVIGIDIGKNSFHMVGLDERGAIGLRQKWSRGQVETRLASVQAPFLRQAHAHHEMRTGSHLSSNPDSKKSRGRRFKNARRRPGAETALCCSFQVPTRREALS